MLKRLHSSTIYENWLENEKRGRAFSRKKEGKKSAWKSVKIGACLLR